MTRPRADQGQERHIDGLLHTGGYENLGPGQRQSFSACSLRLMACRSGSKPSVGRT